MKYLIATARSGSTNLQKYLGKIMPLEQVQKALIHRVPERYGSMFEYADNLLTHFPNSFLLDRRDKQLQAESLCFRKIKYGDAFKHYHHQEYYDTLNDDYISNAIINFEEQSKVIKEISLKYKINILYYEDIFKNIEKVQELGIYHKRLYNEFLDPKHKSRLINQTPKTIV